MPRICFQAISAVCKITLQKSFKTSIKSDEEVKVGILLNNHSRGSLKLYLSSSEKNDFLCNR